MLDSKDVGELYMNACVAGHFNVPVVLVSDDNILEEEVKEVNTAIETVVVKNIEPNIVSYSGKSIIDIYRALTAMIKIANSN